MLFSEHHSLKFELLRVVQLSNPLVTCPGLDQDLVDPLLDILQVATKDLPSDGMNRRILVGWNWQCQCCSLGSDLRWCQEIQDSAFTCCCLGSKGVQKSKRTSNSIQFQDGFRKEVNFMDWKKDPKTESSFPFEVLAMKASEAFGCGSSPRRFDWSMFIYKYAYNLCWLCKCHECVG